MQIQRVIQPKDYAASLIKFRSNEFSQNGEDGIIEHVLNMIGIKNGYACEFGAWDGVKYSNTFALVKKGWSCLMIEADPVKYSDLLETCKSNPSIIPHEDMVHYIPGKGTKLSDILSEHCVDRDFDLLSIDVDSCDYHIWKSLDNKDYHPKIVIVEHSGLKANIIQREGAVHKVDIDGSTAFTPMLDLGESKGYTLLCDTGNMIFLRNDLMHFLTENP